MAHFLLPLDASLHCLNYFELREEHLFFRKPTTKLVTDVFPSGSSILHVSHPTEVHNHQKSDSLKKTLSNTTEPGLFLVEVITEIRGGLFCHVIVLSK